MPIRSGRINTSALFPDSHDPLSSAAPAFRLKNNPPGAASAYLMISETVPAPTVRPPSRIAKRNPFSNATGVISSTVN